MWLISVAQVVVFGHCDALCCVVVAMVVAVGGLLRN